MKLSEEDRDDLFKYIRYFALKASQIIISSRSGKKDSTPCRKKSDWFNLNISDLGGLLTSIKKNISNKVNSGCPVCVEILLQTPEGDKMVLETWCISLTAEYSDPSPKVTHTVYNQMGMLLKSLVSVTRVIPAYKLSQKQDSEFYSISFRMYEKKPEIHALGEGRKQVVIGQICTPVGTVQLSVAYRVKMTITPTHSSRQESSIIVKSDHFNTNIYHGFPGYEQQDYKSRRRGQPIRAAFADPRPPKIKEDTSAFKPSGVLCSIELYRGIIEERDRNSTISMQKSSTTKSITSRNNEDILQVDPLVCKDEVEKMKVHSAASEDLNSSGKSISSENMNVILKFSRQPSRAIGKRVQYPFATPTPESELVNFYRECAHAPPLVSTVGSIPSNKDIKEQLVAFEVKEKEFDDMVKSLCESPDNDN